STPPARRRTAPPRPGQAHRQPPAQPRGGTVMTASNAGSNLPPPAGRTTSQWPRPLTGNEEEPHALAAPPQQPQTRRLDAGATMLRLRALQAMGHSSARIARVIGTSGQVLQRIVRSDAKTVTPAI